jgi:hypothetical protein
MLADMEILVQKDVEPETSEIIEMIGKRSVSGTNGTTGGRWTAWRGWHGKSD